MLFQKEYPYYPSPLGKPCYPAQHFQWPFKGTHGGGGGGGGHTSWNCTKIEMGGDITKFKNLKILLKMSHWQLT